MVAGRRQNYTITESTLIRSFSLDWQPNVFAIQNTTPYIIYVNIGTTSTPSKANFTDIIAPNSSWVSDPAGAYEFAINIDGGTTPAFSFPVNVLFSMGAASVQSPLSLAFVGGGALKVCQAHDFTGFILTPNTEQKATFTAFDYNQASYNFQLGGVKVPDTGIYQVHHLIIFSEIAFNGLITIKTFVNGVAVLGKLLSRLTSNIMSGTSGMEFTDYVSVAGGDYIHTDVLWNTLSANNLTINNLYINLTKLV